MLMHPWLTDIWQINIVVLFVYSYCDTSNWDVWPIVTRKNNHVHIFAKIGDIA